jgi:Secretion system C-terminal sorting domain
MKKTLNVLFITKVKKSSIQFCSLLLFLICSKSYGQFSAGNVVVMQIGNGVSTLTSQGNPIILNEYNSSGTLTYSVVIPSTGTNAMALRGNATSEGYMSKSSDGSNIVFGAYMQALPSTSVLNTSAASAISRGVAVVNAAGVFSIAASSNVTGIASGDIRGATATSSNDVWATSSSQGASYYGTASTATNVENTKTNLRAAHIFNNQLYISSQVATGTPTDIGVYAVGSGTPNTSSQTVTTTIITGASSQPGQFYFNTAGTICYVADARNSALGGVQKWVYSSSTWSLAYTLATGTAAIGAFGVVADFSGTNPLIYATSMESVANRLIAISDVGASSTATTLAVASPSTIFRGIAFSPGVSTATCVPVSITTVTANSPICSSQNLVFNVTTAGTAPITYTWSGAGAFSSNSIPNPTVTGAISGIYTLVASNACGTASTQITVTVNPTPTIQVNAATICSGGVATITASGATTYSWNTGNTNSTFTASPLVTTIYTVSGSSAGCAANSVTTSINITTSPTMSVNSPTICNGSSATITASGASTYTWNTSQTTGVIVVSPTTTTNYTVNGNASGCTATLTATTNVVVNPVPSVTLTINATTVCAGQSTVSLSGLPAGGTFSGTSVSGSAFNPATSGVGTFTLSYTYTNTSNCAGVNKKTITVSPCTTLGESLINATFKVYPNPAKNELYVERNSSSTAVFEILDISGKKVMAVKLNSDTTSISVNTLEAGIYFARLIDGNGLSTLKFIKE